MTLEYVRQVVLATWQAPSVQEADRRVRTCVRRQAVIQPRDPHPGLTLKAGISPVSAGSFSVLESRATGAPDVVYLENRTRIFFVDAAPEVDRYARDFELLTQIALPQDESAEFIHTIANQLRNNTTSGAL